MPATHALDLYRGDTWRQRFIVSDRDLTGVTMQAQIRDRIDGTVQTEITLALTLPNIIDAYLPASTTGTFTSSGVWDLQLTWPNGDIQTILAGPVKLKLDVTKPSAVAVRRARLLKVAA